MENKHWFKKVLKKYNKEQLKTLSHISALSIELSRTTGFVNADQYEINRNYLLDLRKCFKKSKALVLLIDELLLKIDLDFQAYMGNLEKMYPECRKITEDYPEGIFYINCAESKYLRSLQCKQQ